jgi:Mg2+ and Co2+ transporter CorA
VIAVDDRVDKALSNLRELGKTIRSAFGLMHAQLEEAGRERRERTTRFVEIIAVLFLVPTLVVGFFGANTWLPGDGGGSPGTTRAFEVMLIALGVLTMSALGAVLVWQRQQHRRDAEARAERRRLQESMLEMPEQEMPALAPEAQVQVEDS